MKTVSAQFSGNELDAVLNALHEAADAREEAGTPIDCAVARFYRRIANDVEDGREAAGVR